MSQFQLLTGFVHLGGSRDNVAFRGSDEPMTYPEALILRAIHGGEEYVSDLVDVGVVERDDMEELERLKLRYGAEVERMFPLVAGQVSLPAANDGIQTLAEVKAVAEATAKAREGVRAQKAAPKGAASKAKSAAHTLTAADFKDPEPEAKPEPEPEQSSPVPALDSLPTT